MENADTLRKEANDLRIHRYEDTETEDDVPSVIKNFLLTVTPHSLVKNKSSTTFDNKVFFLLYEFTRILTSLLRQRKNCNLNF